MKHSPTVELAPGQRESSPLTPEARLGRRAMLRQSLAVGGAVLVAGCLGRGPQLREPLARQEILPADRHPFAAAHVRRFTTMLIEPSVLIGAVTRDFLLRGGRIHVREFHDRNELLSLEEPVVVNCTGLGSHTLFGDTELIPIKGQLAILLPQPEVDYIMIQGGYYMFPRSDGIVLGGTHDRGDWSSTVDPAVSARIVENHQAVFRSMRSTAEE